MPSARFTCIAETCLAQVLAMSTNNMYILSRLSASVLSFNPPTAVSNQDTLLLARCARLKSGHCLSVRRHLNVRKGQPRRFRRASTWCLAASYTIWPTTESSILPTQLRKALRYLRPFLRNHKKRQLNGRATECRLLRTPSSARWQQDKQKKHTARTPQLTVLSKMLEGLRSRCNTDAE